MGRASWITVSWTESSLQRNKELFPGRDWEGCGAESAPGVPCRQEAGTWPGPQTRVPCTGDSVSTLAQNQYSQ